MKVLFMGTPSYATEILKALLADDEIEVVALITQPDKPVGRKQILTPPHTKAYLQEIESNLEIFQPKTLRDGESIAFIKAQKPDFIVVAAFGQILPKEVLSIAPCINLHASILPKYRGASPIQAAILAQEHYSGVTAMLMDEGLDTGEMLGFSYLNITDMDAGVLFEKLSLMAASLCVEVLHTFDTILPISQMGCDSSYAKKITKSDGEVDFESAATLYAKYLAFIFWPGIYLKSGLKLKEIVLAKSEGNFVAGEILELKKESIVIGCQKGAIEIKKVQPPSKKEMGVVDYIRGKRLGVGDRLS